MDVKIYYESLNDVFLVPEGAIHLGNNGHFIYIINHNNEAEMLDVTKGQSYNGRGSREMKKLLRRDIRFWPLEFKSLLLPHSKPLSSSTHFNL